MPWTRRSTGGQGARPGKGAAATGGAGEEEGGEDEAEDGPGHRHRGRRGE